MIQTLQIGANWFPEYSGGLERVYYHLLRTLPDAGVGVKGLVVASEDALAATNGRVLTGAHPDASLLARWLGVRRAFRRHLSQEKVDLVAAHFALYTAPILHHTGPDLPLVVHFHGPWAWEGEVEAGHALKLWPKAQLENLVYRRACHAIVLSEAFRRVLVERYRVPAERISIVPGGVETSAFTVEDTPRAARERLGWALDRPIVLAVRRLAQRMGLEHLVSAMQTVREHVPEALLLIAGKGPLAEALQARIEALELEQHVQLLGFVPDADLPYAYRAADLTVVPTVALEGFGLITVESMAAGTPPLVTPVGGLPEAVSGLSPDLVLPEATEEAIAHGIVAALKGTLKLPDAQACQVHARARHDWSVVATQTKDVYLKALG